ncbi:MAG: hypothetical protein M1383_01420 [Patescibacteria group bacterium]|nr:hypothetical protein [Patescibacteria group bacterium]
MRPANKIKTQWSSNLAYVVGLIATDGCLYNDGRHMAFVSKDLELVKIFKNCLGIKNKISIKHSGYDQNKAAYWVQFGDIKFYSFLLSIGLTPAKSKTIAGLKIPNKYFFDFLRGSFDGDGTFYSYWDKRWASSFMFYLEFISASLKHLQWVQKRLFFILKVKGHFNTSFGAKVYQLKYAKSEAQKIIAKMYANEKNPMLERKYRKVYTALAINRENP